MDNAMMIRADDHDVIPIIIQTMREIIDMMCMDQI